MNIESRRPLAFGRTAEIYAWPGDRVLKLFHDWFPPEHVEYEARIARAVYSAGLNVPEVGDILEVDGRLGLEYERLRGILLWEEMMAKPWELGKHARLLARLQAEIHAITGVQGLPALRARLEKRIGSAGELSSEVREASLLALSHLPDGKKLCHGDFHPLNVILTAEGPVVIDWIDAAIGSAPADVARTTVLTMGAKATARPTSLLEKVMLEWGHRVYRKRYFELRPGGEEEYQAWIPLVAAARLSEGIEELTPWLRGLAETVLRDSEQGG
jgi:thiamine kinase